MSATFPVSPSIVALAEPAAGQPLERVKQDLTLHGAALAVLAVQHGAVMANEARTRDGDVEALHDMRVAVRRMRAALSSFSDALPARAKTMRGGLGWLGGALGEVRDLDVHLEHIKAWAAGAEGSERRALALVERSLAAQRTAARTRLLRVLDSQRRQRLAGSIEQMIEHGTMPRSPIARLPVVDAAPDIVARRYRKVRSLGDSLTAYAPVETLHALRIRCKRLRYVVEFFAPLYGKPARSLVKRIVRVQDLLGAHQDAIVSEAMLVDLAEALAPEPGVAFAMGRLAERHAREAAGARSLVPEVYEAITGRRWRALQRAMDEMRTQSRVTGEAKA